MSLVGETGIQACLSCYFVGSSVTRITHLSRLLLQSHSSVLPVPSLAFATSGFGPCCPHSLPWGPPNRHVGGARLSRWNREEPSSAGLLRGFPGLHNVVLQPPDPRHTQAVPALLQLPLCCSACPPLLSPDPLPCSCQSMDTLPPCWGQSTVPQDSLPQVAQSCLPLLP